MKFMKSPTNPEEGQLLVVSNAGRITHLACPLDSVFDWYPLNSKYDYRYSKPRSKLYLTPVDELADEDVRYHVRNKRDRATSDIACTTTDVWYNPEVVEENKKVFAYARFHGIITPEKPYTMEAVQAGLEIVHDILDELYSQAQSHFLTCCRESFQNKEGTEEDQTQRALYSEYINSDRENQASIVLDQCPEGLLVDYRKTGEVYEMLNVMRKVVS